MCTSDVNSFNHVAKTGGIMKHERIQPVCDIISISSICFPFILYLEKDAGKVHLASIDVTSLVARAVLISPLISTS